MKIYYEPVFHVESFHSFYKDNQCRALVFEPTASCKALLNQCKLVYKGSETGFGLVGEKRNTGPDNAPVLEPFVTIPVGTKFYFCIQEDRADFLNITDADMDVLAEGKKFFLRNKLSTPVVVNGPIATFNIHNNVSLTETLMVDHVQFYAPVNLAENPEKLVLVDADGSLFVEQEVPRDSSNVIAAEKILISKSPLPEGVYELQQVNAADVVTSSQGYFLAQSGTPQRLIGILMIDYNAVMQTHDDKEVRITMQFANRSVRWVYQVEIERYTDPAEAGFTYNPDHLFLNNPGNNVASVGSVFNKLPILSPDPLGNDKVRWESVNLIAVREEAYREVTLINTNLATTLIEDMANPEPIKMKDDGMGGYKTEVFMKIK